MKEKINRHKIIKNLVDVPDQAPKAFWQKEMVLLKKLEKRFGIDFLNQLKVESKVPTVAFYFAPWKLKLLEIEFKEYYYNHLHKEDLASEQKIGKDAKVSRKKTIKEFLT